MLILTRKQNESIIIDGNIKVTVLNDPQGQVRLGIEAPDCTSSKPIGQLVS